MSKALKVAAIVVGVAAIALTAGTVLFGAAAVAGTLGVTAATLSTITLGLTLTASALSIAAGLAAPKPSFGSLAGAGTQLDFLAETTAGQPYVMGNARVGESIVHQASWGDKNKYLGILGVLSCAGRIMGYDGLYADNSLVPFVSGGVSGSASGYYTGYLSQGLAFGARPQAAALIMNAPGGSAMPNWGSDYKMSSLATSGLVLVADVENGKMWSGGVPQFTHQVRGVLCYDPRLDSTNGGSGSARPAGIAQAETGYAYSENPWVHHGTFALGRWVNGVRVIGPGLPATSIDWGSHIDAANIADANGWTISGRVLSTDNKWDVLRSIAQAGGGYPIPTQAKLACLVNTPRVSLETVEEQDLKGPASVPQMTMRRDRLNGAIPRYREPSLAWQVISGDAVRNSDYLGADGGNTKTKEIDLPLVADKDQAAQLVAYEVANSRERSPIQIELDLYWSQYKTGDCLTLNLPSALLFNQKCVVIGREVDPDSNTVRFTFRTENDAKHAWALGVTGSVPPTTTVGSDPGAGDTGGSLTQAELTTLIQNSYVTGLTFSIADTGSVTISNHTRVYADKSVGVTGTGGSPHAVSSAVAGDGVYVYYDDSNRAGGAVSYQHLRLPGNTGNASSAFPSVTNPYRHFVCFGLVPVAGGSTGGGSDVGSGGGTDAPQCVTVDTPILMADGSLKPAGLVAVGDLVRTRHEDTLEWGNFPVVAISIARDRPVFRASVEGKLLRGTGMHRVWLDDRWQHLRDLGELDGNADVVRMTVADAHTYVSSGILSHNLKPESP